MNHDVKIWKDRCDRLWEFIELYASGFMTEATDAWNGPKDEDIEFRWVQRQWEEE
tara:strand:+ start:148 stop:312 length:165 start_codon:yes stop_codon:yes gene_type:complete